MGYAGRPIMNNDGKYILNGHEPVPCEDLMVWAKWIEENSRQVARDQINNDVYVSTVFLGIDYSFGEGAPVLFETMVFGGSMDQEMDRYLTWDEAMVGHKKMVERVKLESKDATDGHG